MVKSSNSTKYKKADEELSSLVHFIRAVRDAKTAIIQVRTTIHREISQDTNLSSKQSTLEEAFSRNFIPTGTEITYADGVMIEVLNYAIERNLDPKSHNLASQLRSYAKEAFFCDDEDAPKGGDKYIPMTGKDKINPTVRSLATIRSVVEEVVVFLTRHKAC